MEKLGERVGEVASTTAPPATLEADAEAAKPHLAGSDAMAKQSKHQDTAAASSTVLISSTRQRSSNHCNGGTYGPLDHGIYAQTGILHGRDLDLLQTPKSTGRQPAAAKPAAGAPHAALEHRAGLINTSAAPATLPDSDSIGMAKVTKRLTLPKFVASELHHPEAPNAPIRGVPLSYCDAVRSRPPTARVNAQQHLRRPRAKTRWRPLLLEGKPAPPPGYKTPFAGHCYRCLGRDHKLAECRDPLRCLTCRGNGHLARDCPLKKPTIRNLPIHSRLTFPKSSIHSRLSFPQPVKPPIHSRLAFPPLPQPSAAAPTCSTNAEMTWYPGMPENRPAAGSAVVLTSAAMVQETTRLRTRAVLLVARNRPHNIDITIGDVSRVVAGCVRMPPHEMRTMRHRPEDFMIIFDAAHQRTLALRVGNVRVKEVLFNIVPWTEHAHGGDVTWWYHVRMAIENLPSHAWNLDVLKEMLGEVCLFDKIDRATYRQQASDILYCWAWMWFPDALPRSKTVTFFSNGAGQTPPPLGTSQQPREVAPPPRGKSHNLIIHLDLVEDWSPPRERTPSSGQSGIPSSVSSGPDECPRIYNFDDWQPGVLDGLQARPRPVACRPPQRSFAPSPDDDNDDERRQRDPSRGLLQQGIQAFSLLRRTTGSSNNGPGDRQRTRSPPPSRRWARDAEDDAGQGRGRQLARDAHTSPRRRDPMRLEDANWERRRSRSPPAKSAHTDLQDAALGAIGKGDLGSALFSGTLVAAEEAPPPPPRHPDPMMDWFKETCTGNIWTDISCSFGNYDPMLAEAMAACSMATSRPLSFYPDGSPREELHSPVYTPNSTNWDKIAELTEEAQALGLGNVIHFGPGVQREENGRLITTGITEQAAEELLNARRDTIVSSMFVPCEQPVLATPSAHMQQGKTSGKTKATKTAVGTLRRSTRQKAKISSVPVSKRASHRLIKAFGVAGNNEPIGDEALQAYVQTFATPLSPEHIEAVRRLTSLDSGPVMAATAQLAAAEGDPAAKE